jgi:hypothetical protein
MHGSQKHGGWIQHAVWVSGARAADPKPQQLRNQICPHVIVQAHVTACSKHACRCLLHAHLSITIATTIAITNPTPLPLLPHLPTYSCRCFPTCPQGPAPAPLAPASCPLSSSSHTQGLQHRQLEAAVLSDAHPAPEPQWGQEQGHQGCHKECQGLLEVVVAAVHPRQAHPHIMH